MKIKLLQPYNGLPAGSIIDARLSNAGGHYAPSAGGNGIPLSCAEEMHYVDLKIGDITQENDEYRVDKNYVRVGPLLKGVTLTTKGWGVRRLVPVSADPTTVALTSMTAERDDWERLANSRLVTANALRADRDKWCGIAEERLVALNCRRAEVSDLKEDIKTSNGTTATSMATYWHRIAVDSDRTIDALRAEVLKLQDEKTALAKKALHEAIDASSITCWSAKDKTIDALRAEVKSTSELLASSRAEVSTLKTARPNVTITTPNSREILIAFGPPIC